MATQTVEFRAPTAQTITAKLFAIGSDTEVASVTATESTNRKGTYAAAYTDVAAGTYDIIALVSSVPVAKWTTTLTLTTATFQARDLLPSEVRTEMDANSTQLTAILDAANYCLTVLAGTIADAQTSAESYTITRNGSTYTIDFTGLDSTGNRSGATLTKS